LPKVTNISFGSIAINGRKHDTDIVVFWDGEVLERERTHTVSERELMDILLKEPEVVIIGTGIAGHVKIDKEALDYAKLNNVDLIAKTTKEAAKDFNELVRRKRVAALFHISD